MTSIPKSAVLRVARPTDNLQQITGMYLGGLGFKLLASFEGHNGFDGTVLGHEKHNYHLEFTHHHGTTVGRAPTQDNLLVFYLPDEEAWQQQCDQMINAGFVQVPSYNSYWDDCGRTFEDPDGYRVVLAKRDWAA
ncbi:VOC family protein [Aestuariispira insulae]|uniref:Prolyl oligopeptidase n=1 Tax=Aestuariispira insulae TaxID=1461337 RepID=A0A3D9HEU8_9PROT|nr:VOC family protein [Aestuariispira insulae]RED48007.1 prolyl oligopeptidase [Aestuariispira insulae]